MKIKKLISKRKINKRIRTIARQINRDYVGFTIDDYFVVGFGLDYDQKYRELDYVGVVEK